MLKRYSARGFGLVEIVIGLALMAIVGVGISRMMSGSMRGARNLAQSMGHQAMKGNLTTLLANPDVCKDSFTGLPFGATSPLIVKRGTSTYVQAGAAFDGMTVSRLDANIAPIGSNSVALATVTMETTRDAGTQMAGAKKAETVYVNLLTNGTTLIRCTGTDTFPFQKLLSTRGFAIPNAATYTTSGVFGAGSTDFTVEGNFLDLSVEGTLVASGLANVIGMEYTILDLTTGAWLDGPTAVQTCGQVGQTSTVVMETCHGNRYYTTVPGHRFRLSMTVRIIIATPGFPQVIPGNWWIVVRDYLNP